MSEPFLHGSVPMSVRSPSRLIKICGTSRIRCFQSVWIWFQGLVFSKLDWPQPLNVMCYCRMALQPASVANSVWVATQRSRIAMEHLVTWIPIIAISGSLAWSCSVGASWVAVAFKCWQHATEWETIPLRWIQRSKERRSNWKKAIEWLRKKRRNCENNGKK